MRISFILKRRDTTIRYNWNERLFLCNYDKDPSRTPMEPGEIKWKTSRILKKYVDQFHHEGRKDFERTAQKYLGVWTTYSGSIPSLKWQDYFK